MYILDINPISSRLALSINKYIKTTITLNHRTVSVDHMVRS